MVVFLDVFVLVHHLEHLLELGYRILICDLRQCRSDRAEARINKRIPLGFKGILDGEYDHLAEGDFYMLGGIEQAVAKYEQRKLEDN